MVLRVVMSGLALCLGLSAFSDSITFDGREYRNVLIHTSPHFYFVTLPDDGRVLTVPAEDVDPASVSIINEVAYRDSLKAKYEENRGRPRGRSYQSMDESQIVADAREALKEADAAAFDVSAGDEDFTGGGIAAGAGDGGGLGVTIAQVQEAVRAQGITLQQSGTQAGHPRYFGRAGSGRIEVDAYGAEENLQAVSVVVTAPDPGQVQMQLMGLVSLISAVAPWAPQWFSANQQTLLATGAIEQTQGGVRVTVQAGQTGANISITIIMQSVA